MHAYQEKLVPIYIKLPKQDIAYIKFVLESYCDLGVVRTLDSSLGEIVILALSCTANKVYELIESLKGELNIRVIPKPHSAKSDWLLQESEE
ncbi:MAG: DUF4911 domain-containing protein [Deltaproteobacteria bacterium]|nr:DUF4911 domain-containing protein [Deltaproteobacteria bacterium]